MNSKRGIGYVQLYDGITRVAVVQLDEGVISHVAGLKLPDTHVWFERAQSDKSIGVGAE